MAILIKNPETERKARELAMLTGATLTGAIDEAVQQRLEQEQAKPGPRRTLDDMIAATQAFRRSVGLDKRRLKVTRADFDAVWEDDHELGDDR